MSKIPLVRRILTEHRRAVVALVAALIANVLAYAFLGRTVYTLIMNAWNSVI